jgi:hypothetical protein
MSDFSTDRLEPAWRGAPVSSQAEQRNLPPKNPRRPKPPPKAQPDRNAEALEAEETLHRVDDLA